MVLMTTATNDSVVHHTETYKGREITVDFRPRLQENRSSRAAGFEVHVDGRTYQGGFIVTETYDRAEQGYVSKGVSDESLIKKAIKKGRQWVDADIADAEIRPSLENCIAYVSRKAKASLVCTGSEPTDFEVGDLVWFYSRGNFRSGRIEKIGKTNVGVAYVTEVGGIITRKSLKPGEVGFAVEEI